MENSLFSDIKLIEPLKKLTNKSYMPYKQIGFFEDKLLSKNISSLKTNLEKRENFIKTYNSPQSFRIKNFVFKISNGNTERKENEQKNGEEVKKDNGALPNISPDVKAEANSSRKTKSNFFLNKNNKNEKQGGVLKNISIKNENKFNPNTTSFSDKTKFNFSNEKKDVKANIKAISTKHKNIRIDHNLKIDNNNNQNQNNININNNLDKSRITNNSNILKNQIISGHLNKEIQQMENKGSEISSMRNTLYSNFTPAKADYEADARSFMTGKKDNKNVSVDCGNDSFRLNYNKSKNSSPQKEVIDSKIDFVYKKIFDKKSRILIEKSPIDKYANEAYKKKQKSKIESKSTDLIFNNKGAKKRQYIEDKIEDIKRKIFFIKGVYDFSYPKIIVNKVKTAQDFYQTHHTEQKMKLRESMNNTSQKFLEKFEEKCKMTTEEFRKSFQVDKNLFQDSVEKLDAFDLSENLNVYPETENKMIKSNTSLDFKPLRNPRLTLTQKFANPSVLTHVKVLHPISVRTIYPDLGEPSKLKVIHKSKIL